MNTGTNAPVQAVFNSLVQVGLLLVILIGVMLVAYWWRRRMASRAFSDMDFREFSPWELDRLKERGLLSEEETKRLQAIIAEKAMESMHRSRTQPVERVDLQNLLAEAERLRKEHLLREQSSPKGE